MTWKKVTIKNLGALKSWRSGYEFIDIFMSKKKVPMIHTSLGAKINKPNWIEFHSQSEAEKYAKQLMKEYPTGEKR